MKINHSRAIITAVSSLFFFSSATALHVIPGTPQGSENTSDKTLQVMASFNPDTMSNYPSSTPVIPALPPLRTYFEEAKSKYSPQDPAFFSHAMAPFIKNQFNAIGYADNLSRDGRIVTEFLFLANEFKLSTEHTYTGLRLFFNKYKEASVVDDTVVMHILQALPEEIEHHFPLNPINSSKQKAPAKVVENILLTELTDHLQEPKVSTEKFFTQVSYSIAQSLKEVGVDDEQAMRDRLRVLARDFADLLISKTLWYPQHSQSIWPSFLQIAHNVSQLCSNRVLNHLDDQDNILQTLICHFVSFIDLSGQLLPVEWYDSVISDLENGLVPFLESDELDEGITLKKEKLLRALDRGRTCAIAQQTHGLYLQ